MDAAVVTKPDRRAWSSPLSTRKPGLDGIRAVALSLVVAYHVAPDLLPGGYIGVSVFFTLSGFLITSLLINEVADTKGVNLRAFWLRRAKRLLPLAWLTVGVVALCSVFKVWTPDQSSNLPGETIAALGNFSNWWQIGHNGYINAFLAPSPLRHFWSLAIEEQFYLAWPILISVATIGVRRGRRSAVPIVIIGMTIASFIATLLATDNADLVYLSTLSRMGELTIGAGLAWTWRPKRFKRARVAHNPRATGAAALALVALGWISISVRSDSSIWGSGGFLLVAFGSTAIIVATLRPGPVSTVLSAQPLSWLGRRSYAAYLFHWPILVALPISWPRPLIAVVTVSSTLVLSALAHRVIERPVQASKRLRPLLVAGAAIVPAMLVAAFTSVPDTADTVKGRLAPNLRQVADPSTNASTAPPTTCPPATTTTSTSAPPELFDPATVEQLGDPYLPPCGPTLKVLIVGDSTGRGAANALRRSGIPQLEIWDRTVLGCSLGYVGHSQGCPDWHANWARAVTTVRPDVVLAYMGVSQELADQPITDFTSPSADANRVRVVGEATDVLASTGAKVVWTLPAPPVLPIGAFYCQGRTTKSPCDPAWVGLWGQSLRTAAEQRGMPIIDVAAWIAQRAPNAVVERPDGLHLTGATLTEHAIWLSEQLRTVAGQ